MKKLVATGLALALAAYPLGATASINPSGESTRERAKLGRWIPEVVKNQHLAHWCPTGRC
jgi:hypothetical protein